MKETNGWMDEMICWIVCQMHEWRGRSLPFGEFDMNWAGFLLLLSLTRAGRSNPQALEPGGEKHCGYFVGWCGSIQRKNWQILGAFLTFKPWTNSWKLRRVSVMVKRVLTHGQGLTASLGKKPILLVARILPCKGKRLLIALQIYMTGSR